MTFNTLCPVLDDNSIRTDAAHDGTSIGSDCGHDDDDDDDAMEQSSVVMVPSEFVVRYDDDVAREISELPLAIPAEDTDDLPSSFRIKDLAVGIPVDDDDETSARPHRLPNATARAAARSSAPRASPNTAWYHRKSVMMLAKGIILLTVAAVSSGMAFFIGSCAPPANRKQNSPLVPTISNDSDGGAPVEHGEGSQPPTLAPVAGAFMTHFEYLAANLPPSQSLTLYDPSSCQHQALTWLSETADTETLYDPRRLDFLKERYALAVLYFALSWDATATQDSFWISNWSTCSWKFVSCNRMGYVEQIDIYSTITGGSLPPEIGLLTQLKLLSFVHTEMVGIFPTELGNLLKLEYLVIHDNWTLGGRIPSEIGQLKKLRVLDIPSNDLTGTIPTELGMMKQLEYLGVDTNRLGGPIPSELGLLENLQVLALERNKLTGSIPFELGGLTNLQEVSLRANRLAGEVPESLRSWKKLDALLLDHNPLLTGINEVFCQRPNDIHTFVATDCSARSIPKCSCCTFCCESTNNGACFFDTLK